ncbi:MAG TPA: DUF5700 domain-containing putative Zn-dependent protease [Candidatus Bathyarchaeia archaeon]|nr:DUF5700 domain-containing putative Zn-dependent protease [Candidatus Bathyarchaeia archaeon]
MTLKVTIDTSFIDEVLTYLNIPNNENFLTILKHEAAKEIHDNALLSQSTTKTIKEFWEEIILKEKNKGPQYNQKILSALEYIIERKNFFIKEFQEIEKFIPSEKNIKCKLYLMIGYDIGIANKNNAYINLGYPLFHKDPKELLYFSMHELHHVVYFNYHPIKSLNEIKTSLDLLNVIKYYTFLEGLATYLTLNKRIQEQDLTFKDYKILTNKRLTRKYTREYFKIISELSLQAERPVTASDFDILEQMSGGRRLWYITGAYMVKTIDEIIGRDMLIKTMKYGPESLFVYHKSITYK